MSSADYSFGATASAAVYAGANEYNWLQNLLLPGLQAAANILIIEKQKDKYDAIDADRRRLIDTAVDNYVTRVTELLPNYQDAYPDVPQAAEYVPVDPCVEQRQAVECNLGNTTSANEWAMTVSRLQAQSDYTRMVVLDPRWYVNVDLHAMTIHQLLKGEYPVGDLMEVMTDCAEQALATGRIGGNGRMTRRSVATGRLRMQQQGRDALKAEARLMGRISPTSRMASPSEMMSTPQQRIALMLTQAQLIQNSLQNIFNAEAQKPPFKMAQLSLRMERVINQLQMEAAKASLVNTFVPNYSAILQPQINALSSVVSQSSPRPYSPASSADAPEYGGSYVEQSAANPYTSPLGDLNSSHRASDRPSF